MEFAHDVLLFWVFVDVHYRSGSFFSDCFRLRSPPPKRTPLGSLRHLAPFAFRPRRPQAEAIAKKAATTVDIVVFWLYYWLTLLVDFVGERREISSTHLFFIPHLQHPHHGAVNTLVHIEKCSPEFLKKQTGHKTSI